MKITRWFKLLLLLWSMVFGFWYHHARNSEQRTKPLTQGGVVLQVDEDAGNDADWELVPGDDSDDYITFNVSTEPPRPSNIILSIDMDGNMDFIESVKMVAQ